MLNKKSKNSVMEKHLGYIIKRDSSRISKVEPSYLDPYNILGDFYFLGGIYEK
jgi:hypothetical protein